MIKVVTKAATTQVDLTIEMNPGADMLIKTKIDIIKIKHTIINSRHMKIKGEAIHE